MENAIEDPISPAVLAKDVGMSTRQLERLFRRYLDRSPKRYYMELRLQKARNLLMQTEHERDQRGLGLRLCQPVALFEMLPGRTIRPRHTANAAPRAWRDCRSRPRGLPKNHAFRGGSFGNCPSQPPCQDLGCPAG